MSKSITVTVRIEVEDSDKPFGIWEYLNDLEANTMQYFGAESFDARASGYLDEFAGVISVTATEVEP